MFLSLKRHNLSAANKSQSKGNWETERHKCLPRVVGRALSCPLSNSVLCWVVLGSVGLGCVDLCWVRVDWLDLDWVGLTWAGLGWVGLTWVGLYWAGLIWAELGWVGLLWVLVHCSVFREIRHQYWSKVVSSFFTAPPRCCDLRENTTS